MLFFSSNGDESAEIWVRRCGRGSMSVKVCAWWVPSRHSHGDETLRDMLAGKITKAQLSKLQPLGLRAQSCGVTKNHGILKIKIQWFLSVVKFRSLLNFYKYILSCNVFVKIELRPKSCHNELAVELRNMHHWSITCQLFSTIGKPYLLISHLKTILAHNASVHEPFLNTTSRKIMTWEISILIHDKLMATFIHQALFWPKVTRAHGLLFWLAPCQTMGGGELWSL